MDSFIVYALTLSRIFTLSLFSRRQVIKNTGYININKTQWFLFSAIYSCQYRGSGGALTRQRFLTRPSGSVESALNEWPFDLQMLLEIVCKRIKFMQFQIFDMSSTASNLMSTEICKKKQCELKLFA